MPPGSLPRAMDVIIRNEMVETVRPGDKAVFVGSLIVIPDMAAFTVPGERTLLQAKGGPQSMPAGKGVSGINTVGARELHYKLAFLACNVQVTVHTSCLLCFVQVCHGDSCHSTSCQSLVVC
jgi:DNA replication licensing factor MCM6